MTQEEYKTLKECVSVDMLQFALAIEKELDKEKKKDGANKKARKTIK